VAPILELANQIGATGVIVFDHGRELLSIADPSQTASSRCSPAHHAPAPPTGPATSPSSPS
jgi:hypothetical protein